MERGVAAIERPVLALEVLQFLKKHNNTCMSEMVSEGWNKRTLASTLKKLRDVQLIEVEPRGSFPTFEKTCHLTDRGDYVAHFVIHLEEELISSSGMDLDEFSRLPKGCMVILILILQRGYQGISRVIEELGISPHQIYRCLSSMESKGILYRQEHQKGRRTVSSFHLSERGISVAVAVDALDKALRTPAIFD